MINCEKEIIELHQFFQDWFNGEIPEEDDIFARFSAVMADGFYIVSPNGRLTLRTPLVENLRQLHANSHSNPGKIWIQDVQIRHQSEDLILATYEEWQEFNGETTSRLSSVLFQVDDSAPNGLAWLYVHEIWLGK
ncbi:hypothetical protein [Candidatus Leptofilum sp.]|uniref:hypothetical protein n=1 Tax=Candidatus Leptofilum sp. TaxID=3241576 RepID=UPI003B5C9FF0